MIQKKFHVFLREWYLFSSTGLVGKKTTRCQIFLLVFDEWTTVKFEHWEKEGRCLVFTSSVSRRSRATTAKKCTNQRDPRTKLLFCQSNPLAFLPSSLPSLSSLLKLPTNVPLKRMKQRPCWWTQKSSGTWIGLFSSHVKNFFSLKSCRPRKWKWSVLYN